MNDLSHIKFILKRFRVEAKKIETKMLVFSMFNLVFVLRYQTREPGWVEERCTFWRNMQRDAKCSIAGLGKGIGMTW